MMILTEGNQKTVPSEVMKPIPDLGALGGWN
jgi:hypothetical protein